MRHFVTFPDFIPCKLNSEYLPLGFEETPPMKHPQEPLDESREDRGQIAVLDGRILTKSYGRVFLQMLPECEVEILEFE